MNKLALYCRIGFEKEVVAEITDRASERGVFGFARVVENSGYVIFECYQPGDADRLAREIPFNGLIFARQMIVISDLLENLDPQDRIDDLGDASVPFNFDVHAMIFSDDAPALEAALHRAFEDRKLNMVNQRREFFNVTLDEIKEVIRQNFDKTVEFVDVPNAEQYRVSQKLRAEKKLSA